jgi:dGTP triphosphohydrolase
MKEFSVSLKERRLIEDNKQFARLIEKTQVNVPQTGRHEVIKNRLTHSYEVATSSLTIASAIADRLDIDVFDIDYRSSLYNVSLLHDLGHPPFGHDGATLLDKKLKELGLKEGFSDNNNNLKVIEKNNIDVRDYVLASTIKYPHLLYSDQKAKYIPILKDAISQDIKHFEMLGIKLQSPTKTMACEIMDEADRNSYTFSDMTDFLCTGGVISKEDIVRIAGDYRLSENDPLLKEFIEIVQSGDKSIIKEGLGNFKERANQGYTITDNGLEMIDSRIEMLREAINKMTMEFYISPIRKLPFHNENIAKLSFIFDQMASGEFLPSKHYSSIIRSSECSLTKLRAVRDMIGENSDWYILGTYDDLQLKHSAKNTRKPFEQIILDAKELLVPSKEDPNALEGIEPNF